MPQRPPNVAIPTRFPGSMPPAWPLLSMRSAASRPKQLLRQTLPLASQASALTHEAGATHLYGLSRLFSSRRGDRGGLELAHLAGLQLDAEKLSTG